MDRVDRERFVFKAYLRYELDQAQLLSTRLFKKADRPPELLHEVVCKQCGVPVLRVAQLKAPPGGLPGLITGETVRVILTRARKPNDEAWPETEPSIGWVEWYSQRRQSLRLDTMWNLLPLADDEPNPDDAPTVITSAFCWGSSFPFSGVLALQGSTTRMPPPRRSGEERK